jgi:hypothetical protein
MNARATPGSIPPKILLTDGFAQTAELKTFPDDVLVNNGGKAYAAAQGLASGANAAARA